LRGAAGERELAPLERVDRRDQGDFRLGDRLAARRQNSAADCDLARGDAGGRQEGEQDSESSRTHHGETPEGDASVQGYATAPTVRTSHTDEPRAWTKARTEERRTTLRKNLLHLINWLGITTLDIN